jgi:hypothetical protein
MSEKAPLTPIAAGASSQINVDAPPSTDPSSSVAAFIEAKDLTLLEQNKMTFDNADEFESFLSSSYYAAFCACSVCTCGVFSCAPCMSANIAAGFRLEMDHNNVEITKPYPLCCCAQGQEPVKISLEQISSVEVSEFLYLEKVYLETSYIWAKIVGVPPELMHLQIKQGL